MSVQNIHGDSNGRRRIFLYKMRSTDGCPWECSTFALLRGKRTPLRESPTRPLMDFFGVTCRYLDTSTEKQYIHAGMMMMVIRAAIGATGTMGTTGIGREGENDDHRLSPSSSSSSRKRIEGRSREEWRWWLRRPASIIQHHSLHLRSVVAKPSEARLSLTRPATTLTRTESFRP